MKTKHKNVSFCYDHREMVEDYINIPCDILDQVFKVLEDDDVPVKPI